MKILGLLLVLGIGIFLIWFFEEIFKDSSEEDYEDYEYEMPGRTARAEALTIRSGARAVRPEVRTARSAVRMARPACSSIQQAASGRPVRRTPEAAWISAGGVRSDMNRVPSGAGRFVAAGRSVAAGRNDMTGQSCRKSA